MDTKYYNQNYDPDSAVCHFHANTGTNEQGLDNGYAFLTQTKTQTIIQLDLYNLPPGVKGFHIHQSGDLSQGCNSVGSHYNPSDHTHGGLNANNSHLGDLGNIVVDNAGRCRTTLFAKRVALSGPYSVVGRAMVIHSDADDLGLGDNEESLKTGNSGARISCGIIELL